MPLAAARKRQQRDPAEGLLQHDTKLCAYYDSGWFQCDECLKWRRYPEQLGETDRFVCDLALGQGGCEQEEDTSWIFEPGFHGAHSELDDAAGTRNQFCENALTHWTHKFSFLCFWKQNRDAEAKALAAINQCRRLPRDGPDRVKKLQSIFVFIYQSLNKQCLNDDHDDVWNALKADLDQVKSALSSCGGSCLLQRLVLPQSKSLTRCMTLRASRPPPLWTCM